MRNSKQFAKIITKIGVKWSNVATFATSKQLTFMCYPGCIFVNILRPQGRTFSSWSIMFITSFGTRYLRTQIYI